MPFGHAKKPKPVVAVVPARGGSVELPRKNLRMCAGKPLTEWTLAAAQQASTIDAVILSSDDPEILALADKYPKVTARLRDAELSTSTTSTEAVLESVLAESAWSVAVLLQPTSPIRAPYHIDAAVHLLEQAGADSVVSVVPSHDFLWRRRDGFVHPMYALDARYRRQEMTHQFRENGSIYIFTREAWERHHNRIGTCPALYVMPPETGYEVDSELDLFIVEQLLARHQAVGELSEVRRGDAVRHR